MYLKYTVAIGAKKKKSKIKSVRALGIVGMLRCWPRLYALLLKVVFLCLIFFAEYDNKSYFTHTQK